MKQSLILLLLLFAIGCDDLLVKRRGGGERVNPVNPPKPHVFRVLIVEKASDRASLSSARLTILTSKAVREFMKTHCTKGPDGKTPEFRIADKDADMAGESELWQATLARCRSKPLPYFCVENESNGTEGPLPEDVDRFLQILKPYTESEKK